VLAIGRVEPLVQEGSEYGTDTESEGQRQQVRRRSYVRCSAEYEYRGHADKCSNSDGDPPLLKFGVCGIPCPLGAKLGECIISWCQAHPRATFEAKNIGMIVKCH
jgi:hypothetical protein